MIRQLMRSRRVRRQAVLSRLAGHAAGARRSRRGSFLIMVVGTLALLAVVTIVYVAIGRSDAQASAAVVKQGNRDLVVEQFRNYALGVISDDVFDVVYLGERDADNRPLYRREVWDHPSTAYSTRVPAAFGDLNEPVTVGGANTRAWFTPTGNYTGADPWLASSGPTLLNIDGSEGSETNPALLWEERLDWAHLSNFAPDGSPVNLFNLRDNFFATPWEMRGSGPQGKVSRLTASPEAGNSRGDELDFGGTAVDASTRLARPAEWDSRIKRLFYPAVDPRFGPRDAEYLLYQYADADGDGILDSRWMEMVLARDENNPQDMRWLIPADERYRYFFAVRAEDLSGRVNLNTATDQTLSPEESDPWGMTPSAVDVRSLLTMLDLYGDMNFGFGYDAQEQPKIMMPGDPNDYSGYDLNVAYEVGDRAYDALRMLLDLGLMPEPGYQGLLDLDTSGAGVDREFSSPYWQISPTDYYERQAGFGLFGGEGTATSGLGRSFGADSLLELLAYNGVNDPMVRSPVETILGGRADTYGRYSPVRDNRSLRYERGGRYTINGPRITMDDDAKAWAFTDLRGHLTTMSGARPLAPTFAAERTSLSGSDLKLDRDTLFATGGTAIAGQRLFELYANALAPYSEIQQHWDLSNNNQYRTLYYGWRGPETAVRTAAHMGVNMLDSFDEGDRPTVRTVLLNGSQSFRTTFVDNNARDPMYPWKLMDLDLAANNGRPRLADRTIAGMPDAVNVFGVEATPFVVAASSYITYTDVREAYGGDDDVRERRLNGIPVATVPPSIDGDPRNANVDCLFEVLAFQVHNPFDETITLTGESSDPTNMRIGQYYLQYGDPSVHGDASFIKLAEADYASRTEVVRTITLGPRESKVFYIMSGSKADIAARLNKAEDDGQTGGVDWLVWIDGWLNRQVGQDAIPVTWCDPTDGRLVFKPSWDNNLSTTFTSLQGNPSQKGTTEAQRRVVRLWRVEKPEFDVSNGGYRLNDPLFDEQSLNVVANDTLVDRMRDPATGRPTLDRQLVASPLQQGRINGADPGLEPDQGDNRGLTITRYGVLARRQDPNSAAGTVPLGGLPAYCVESKTGTHIDNLEDLDPSGTDTGLSIGDFSGPHAADTLSQFVLSRPTLADVVKQEPYRWAQDASDWGGEDPGIGANRAGVPFQGDASNNPLYVEPGLNNDEFEVDVNGNAVSVMRLADFLAPMGVGPHQIPDPAYNQGNQEIEWTTLSEALAWALDYDEPASAQESVYFDAFDMPGGGGFWGTALLETGHLRNDAFVPFRDMNQDGMYTAPGDVRWGVGVPFAATIFDFTTTIPREFGSLASPTFGQVNINTAPREVLRALPGFAPPPDAGPDGLPVWWWTGGEHDLRSDIATNVFGYRDRVALAPRDLSGAGGNDLLDFRDSNDGAWDSAGFAPGTSPVDNGRFEAVGIDGLREEPGFRSLGELTFVRNWLFPVGGYAGAHDIDRLGFDDDRLDRPGVDSITYDDDNGDGTREDDGITDDFDERFAIANAAMNSSSVRSDFFAVWFIVHGYQESDVKNLGPNDPMVPTIARRFVMVVDRSNVVVPGQRPRVVLFKEVPL